MIETQEALDNLDAILSTPGLDAIYVGPSDLSISLGYAPGGDKADEWMMAALKKVLDGCKRHKVQPGIHCGAPAYAKKMIEMGFTFVTVGGDNRFMTMGGQAAIAEMKDVPRPGAAPALTRSRAPGSAGKMPCWLNANSAIGGEIGGDARAGYDAFVQRNEPAGISVRAAHRAGKGVAQARHHLKTAIDPGR